MQTIILNYFSPLLDVTVQSSQKHGLYLSYTNLATTDYIRYLYLTGIEFVTDDSPEAMYHESFTHGITGEINGGMNVLVKPKLIIAAGANVSSYRMNPSFYEYRGSFYGLGPFVNVDFLASEKLLLRLNAHVWKSVTDPQRFSYINPPTLSNRFRSPYPDAKKPWVIKISTELVTKGGFIAGLDYRRFEVPESYAIAWVSEQATASGSGVGIWMIRLRKCELPGTGV